MPIVDCASGSRPIIKWRYPNELQEQTPGNEYDVIGAYNYSQWYFEVRDPNSSSTTPKFIGEYSLYEFTGEAQAWESSNRDYYLIAECKNREVDVYFAQRRNRPPPAESTVQIECNSARPGYRVLGNIGRSIPVLIVSKSELRRFLAYQPVVENITFQVKDNGTVVYNRTANTVPVITTECVSEGGCPPDTCEVDCGTHICCYNSEGISVFNYNK